MSLEMINQFTQFHGRNGTMQHELNVFLFVCNTCVSYVVPNEKWQNDDETRALKDVWTGGYDQF
jgi:hypothetical protein